MEQEMEKMAEKMEREMEKMAEKMKRWLKRWKRWKVLHTLFSIVKPLSFGSTDPRPSVP
jgi:ribosome recycling factor